MNAKSKLDPLPEEFDSEDEAGEFWDSQSLTDYEDCLEAVEIEVAVTERRFEIEVDESTFLRLAARAKEVHQPMKELAAGILDRGLELNRKAG